MATLTLDDYLTKTQIKQQFGRHPRTLNTDVSKSLECRDEELLSLCRLKRQNGEVIEGINVTPKLRDSLVEDGENPQWYFLPGFVETVVKRQSHSGVTATEEGTEPSKKNPSSTASTIPQEDEQEKRTTPSDTFLAMPQLPKDAGERAAILEHLYLEKTRELIKERSRYDNLLPVIKDIPKQTEKMMEAMQGLQALFANTQEREKALHPGNIKEASNRSTENVLPSTEVVDAQIIVNTVPAKQATRSTKSSVVKTPRTSKKKRSISRAKMTEKKSKRPTAKRAARSTTRKSKTFAERNLPSFTAFFGRHSK